METPMINRSRELARHQEVVDAIGKGWFQEGSHFYPLLAQFEDTDAGGIVYHANYVNYAERGRTAMLRCLGVEMNDLVERDEAIVITSINVQFKKPSLMGDALLVETTPQHLGASRLQLRQVVKGTAGDIRATLDVEGAFVSQNKPIRVPADVRERLREHMPSRSTGLQDQQ